MERNSVCTKLEHFDFIFCKAVGSGMGVQRGFCKVENFEYIAGFHVTA